MNDLTITVDADELAGLTAVIAAAEPDTPDAGADPAVLARQLLRAGLDARLQALGLPWAPTAQDVLTANQLRAARAATLVGALRRNRRLVSAAAALAGIGLAVSLIGGYGFGWSWTGFRDNKQLWDWFQLLVLPVALATLPIWLGRSAYLSRTRQLSYTAALAAFAVFVIVGYETPLGWTGFQGNRLWDWITLLLLPVTVITVRTWLASNREIRARHWSALGVLAAAWVITIIGGYAWNWAWTGYQGNTLWDWLQLTLAPLVIPTILLPSLVTLTTGDAERRARHDRELAYRINAGVTP